MNYLWQKFLVELKYHNRIIFDEFSIIYCGSASSTFLHGLSERIMLNYVRHTNPCIHNSESYMFLELSLSSWFLALVYQLIVKSMHAFIHRCLLFLWSVKPFYPEWLGETNSSTSSISRIGSKSCAPQNKLLIQLLFCSTLEYYPIYVKNIIGIAHHPMNSWYSDTSCHHCSFLGSCVIVTRMPTSES